MNVNHQFLPACVFILLCSIFSVPAFAQEKVIMTATDTTLFNTQPDEEEFKILSEFYKQLNGKKWKKNTNWLKGKTSADMAKWHGVVVRNGDVSEINLDQNNLKGKVPKKLYDLYNLTAVSIEGNNLEEEKEIQSSSAKLSTEAPTMSLMSVSGFPENGIPVNSGKNLPIWGLAVKGPYVQQVDWRSTPPRVDNLINSGPSRIGASGVAIDDCGLLAFYVLHSGVDSPNQLHIYSPNGTQLTNTTPGSPLRALSSANGDIELQVVRVPGKADEWYIIYSLFQPPCLTNPPGSGYCPAKVVYARVKYTPAGGLVIAPDKRQIKISDKTFIQGKAVSRTVNGDRSRHYLYLAQRAASGSFQNFTKIHRFIIDEVGINFGTESAIQIPAKFWAAGIAGSTLELSPDETHLAMNNRNVGAYIQEDIIVFDLAHFNSSTYVPTIISVPNLTVFGTGKSIREMSTMAGYSCLSFLKNKLMYLEFSPSGRYLYTLHGGYPDYSGGVPYNTHLLQIDLQSGSGKSDYDVRMQIQKPPGFSSYSCYGATGVTGTPTWQIQSAYDGRLYFTKLGSTALFVIPNPDSPLAHNLVPDVINLATVQAPNIVMNSSAQVVQMPENIDGYDYLKESTTEKFVLDKTSLSIEENISLTIQGFVAPNTDGYPSYQVSWGDGIVESLTTTAKIHSYTAPGSYEIRLTVVDPAKCASVTSKTVNVVNCSAMTSLAIDHKVYLCAIKFSVLKITDCYATYAWDFGDGNRSSNRSPMHVYAHPGAYTVSVTINYNCLSCRGDITVSKPIDVTSSGPVLDEQWIQVPSDQRVRVISSSAASFSDAWPLDHNEKALENLNIFIGGSEGMWRNEGSFVYNTPRSASSPVAISSDGTYTLERFNWAYAELEAIPKWVKTNSMTRYNAYSFELENKDVMDVHSGALYDYNGQLQSAHGVNMRNEEMGFTSFEHFNNKPTGNFIFSNNPLPAFTTYKVLTATAYVAVVEASLEELAGAERADIKMAAQKGSVFILAKKSRYLKDVKIMCKEVHPVNPAWSVLVFEEAPYQGTWLGEITIKNIVVPVVQATLDDIVAHSGKTSMRIEAEKVFEQKLIHLEAGKSYHLNAWVTAYNPNLNTPKLSDQLGIEVMLKNREGAVISLTSVVAEGKVIEGWQQVKGSFTCPEKDLILSLRFKPGSTGKAWYDDIRLHPENGNLKSYVYNITDYRLSAILDEDNFATFFYYDKEGNLYLTKKETEDGIKTITENIMYQIER
jgi:PKD repeat protein